MQLTKFALIGMALIVLAISCGESSRPNKPVYASLAEAQADMDPADKYVVIDFYTDWCTWCKRLDTLVFVDSTVKDFFANDMMLVRLNAEEDTVTAQTFHVSGYPTLVMVDKDGNEVDRLVGYLDPEPFLQTWRDYAQGIGTLDDLLSKAETSGERNLYMEIAEKYKYRGGSDDAHTWYEKVVAEAPEPDSMAGEARLALADMIRRAKDYNAAIAEYDLIAKDFADFPAGDEAQIWAGITARQAGDTTNAIKRFEKYVKDNPDADSNNLGYVKEQIEKLKNPPPPKEEPGK
ncbi:MAG TPA: thioredoxin domain-containing protein [candidate division Zixibacteria bacterium]|nr:thioredoxin domain-containing protein [candidate division Zixibacteria bacterium]